MFIILDLNEKKNEKYVQILYSVFALKSEKIYLIMNLIQ